MKISNFAFLAIALASTASVAVAADIAPPASNWTGFYVGAGIGAGLADYDVGTTSCDGPDLTGNCNNEGPSVPKGDGSYELYSNGFDSTGVLGTIQAGFDYQVGDALVVGFMADGTIFDVGGDDFNHVEYLQQFTDTAGQGWKADVDNMLTLSGRIGFLAQPDLLVYGLGGWSWADVKTSYFEGCGGSGCGDIYTSGKKTANGFTVGGGVEMLFATNWSGRLEYRYTNLGDVSLYGEEAGYSAETKTSTDVHQIRATVNYRF